MKEGWIGDDYLILFDESEVATVTDRYALSHLLPGYHVLGLRGWDDFIVRDSQRRTFSIPTVPLDLKYIAPCSVTERADDLQPDARFRGKIKWYLKPIVFGGDPSSRENTAWVNLEEHAKLVRWWNDLYRSVKNKE
ncbi:MAG TPA: hypothetical protein VN087_14745 [Verrucomicrobiae bacterium]|jgi:hypothetical protein|nr:hypothetical protein [Verrucomicrobiae bacterium]